MPARVVSLQETTDQLIQPRTWTLVRYSYGSLESYDPWNMHDPVQPDGSIVTDWKNDDRSGLIWPSKPGIGSLICDFIWPAGNYSEIREQFVRDPLGTPDYTSVEHRGLSPGAQYFAKHHAIFVNPSTPIGVLVYHDASTAVNLVYSQFKLVIHDVEEPAGGTA